MKESQTVEFKESWRDDYFKWLCGFANAEGGVLVIGKDDSGQPVGVEDVEKLLEDLPNRIRDLLGVMADVRLVNEDGRELIEIHVEPYPSPISYKGEFHYRSGSTKQVLKGTALEMFLLRKQGRHWDSVVVPYVTEDDLDPAAFKHFRKAAAKSGRMDDAIVTDTPHRILENLNLCGEDGLRRAAVLLFHETPERFIPGAYIKIGFFRNDADLIYQDEIHGSLFLQAQKTFDLLFTKYLKAYIHYEGITRVERFLFPPDALRELIFNAIVHRDYGSGVPIQIRVYDHKMWISNDGFLPSDWTAEHLLSSHTSKPFNPLIAGAFFRSGDIESWGRGIEKVRNACTEYGSEFPTFRPETTGMMVFVNAKTPPPEETQGLVDGLSNGLSDGLSDGLVDGVGRRLVESQRTLLTLLTNTPTLSKREMAESLGISLTAVAKNLETLKRKGLLKRVGSARSGHWEVIR